MVIVEVAFLIPVNAVIFPNMAGKLLYSVFKVTVIEWGAQVHQSLGSFISLHEGKLRQTRNMH